MTRSFGLILVAFILISLFGGSALLANPTFVLVLAIGFGGGLAAAFGHRRLGGTRIGGNIVQTHGPVFAIAAVYTAILYVPIGYIGGWFWTDLPQGMPSKFMMLGWAMLVLFALWSRLPPAPAFPWAPLVALSGAAMRWGFAFIEAARNTPTGFAFVGPAPAWAELVYTGVSLLFAITLTTVIVTAISVITKMRDKGWWWHGFNADNVAAYWMSGSFIRWIAMSVSLEIVRFPTPRNVAEAALRTGNYELIEEFQLRAALNPPDEDTSGWTLQDWDAHYGGQNFLQWVGDHLDVTAFGNPDCNCLPDGYYPGLPGFVTPYDHIEEGLGVKHGGHKLPSNMIDLRPSGPISVWSERITAEHGFEMSAKASLRMRPALLVRAARCKGREALIKDRAKHALGQIIKVVGPRLYGFVGEPLARGGIQRGLIMDEPARDGTPFTRPTSQLTRPLRREDMPRLIEADRQAFFTVLGIIYNLHVEVLRETGMWIIPDSFQIDDVDVPEEIKQILMVAVKSVVMASVAPELRTLQFLATEAKMGAVVAAIQGLNLAPDQVTAILTEAAKLIHLGQGGAASDILLLAGVNTGIKVSGSK